MKWLKKYLSYEVGIDFKTCIYFFMVLFFYSMYQILQGSFFASIIIMAEMLASAYIIGYIQVYLLKNFDEAEQLGRRECFSVFSCSALYTAISYILNWYGRSASATLFFFFYMIACYLSIFLAYKIKRDMETAVLNRELENFKKQKTERM
ncbi:MAG: DUF3021 domain-containing protein [Roseburia sp.]|nr:DUF3021 domain-containing protein [Roseburia sp.]MCM1280069.1 DUF3021 domain-containing protein [Robinsoniella sp.]